MLTGPPETQLASTRRYAVFFCIPASHSPGKGNGVAMSGKRPQDSAARAVEIIMAVLGLAAGIWLVLH
jgi:hypothetical protein